MNRRLKGRIISEFGTQIAFAKVLREHEPTVSRVVRNHIELPRDEQVRWAKALNSKVEDIFGKA